MADGVSFVDGDVSMNVGSTGRNGGSMSEGGPLDTPSDYAGRSAGMTIGNFDKPMPKGGQLDCPAEY